MGHRTPTIVVHPVVPQTMPLVPSETQESPRRLTLPAKSASTLFKLETKSNSSSFQALRRLWSFGDGKFETCVSPMRFRLYWVIILLIYVLDGLFLVMVSVFYRWLLYSPLVIVHVESILHLLPIETLRKLVWVFALVAALHLLTALEIVWCSIRNKRLVLTSSGTPWKSSPTIVADSMTKLPSPARSCWTRLNLLRIQWIDPFLTPDGKHFDVLFSAQEVLQIIAQTYQSFSLSHLVTTKWINQLAVASTFLNCVSSSVVRFVVPYNLPRQRFLCVLCDCLLGFIQAVVIPVIIFARYYQVYDPNTQYFPDELVYDDVWFIEAIRQLDQILIVSYLDFVMTILPHLNFLWSLRGIAHLLRTKVPSTMPPKASKKALVAVFTKAIPSTARNAMQTTVGVSPASVAPTAKHVRTREEQEQMPKRNHYKRRVYGTVCVVYGCLVVLVHMLARNDNPLAEKNCKSHLNPWFTQRFACSIIFINCYRGEIQGTRQEITAILQQFHPSSASAVCFTHCPALEIPPTLRVFDGLVGLDIYNSTLVQWGADAAIDAKAHPVFNYLSLEFVNLSGIPDGLLNGQLPTTFTDTEIYRTNLTSLPESIGAFWPQMNTLFLEFCLLQHLPASLREMEFWFFSIAGNALTDMDSSAFAHSRLNQLLFSNNPLTVLPESMPNANDLMRFSFEHTLVEQVPVWVMDWALNRIDHDMFVEHSAFGTPFCESTVSTPFWNGSTDPNGEMNARHALYKQKACEKNSNTSKGFYPIEIIIQQRPL